DPGVVDEDVEPAELVDRLLDEPSRAGEVGDVLAVRRRLAAARADLLDHLLGRAGIGPFAGEPGAEVVDHNLRSRSCERERVRAADPASCTRDDRDLPAQIGHGERLRLRADPRDVPLAELAAVRDVDVDRVASGAVAPVRAGEVEDDAVEARPAGTEAVGQAT